MAVGGKRPGAGRPPGSLNKVTKTVRENTLAVFEMIGGETAMADWARENRTEFFKLYGRMAPSDPDAPGGSLNPLHTKAVVEFVKP